MKHYSRPRPFVAITRKGTRETLMSSSNRPTKKYITRMVGPFKTNRGAAFYRTHPEIFLRSVNQAEILAREIQTSQGVH